MNKPFWPEGTKLMLIDNVDYEHIPLGTMVTLTADYYSGNEYAEVAWNNVTVHPCGEEQRDGEYRAARFEPAQFTTADKAYYQAITEGVDKLS